MLGLADGKVVFGTADTTVTGDVGVGPRDTTAMEKATIDGRLFLDPTADASGIHPDLVVSCGTFTKDLSGADSDARAASAASAALPPTQTFGDITSSTTITSTGGQNVISVHSIDLHDTLTLVGAPSDEFIVNVTGDLICNGCAINLSGGVPYTNVLFNVLGSGTDVQIFKPVAVANGIFLAPNRGILVDKGTLNGAVIGAGTATSTLTVHSGATINFCPPCPACSTCSQAPNSISSNFNGTPIRKGNFIWFTSVLKVDGLGSNPGTVHFTGQTIQFSAAGTPFTLDVPNASVRFSPTATLATTVFSAATHEWETTLPSSGVAGNDFVSGLAFQVPFDLPGGINPVTWSGTFSSPEAGLTIHWQWAAAVYNSFSTDYDSLGVKPTDDNSASIYQNSDHAGTPENFKSFVIGGARGGGGSNFTGSLSATAAASCP